MQRQMSFLSNLPRQGTVLIAAAGILLSAATVSEARIKRIPISVDRLNEVLTACLLSGGGDHRNDHQLPVFCCATNSEGTNYCVACYTGNEQHPGNCEISTKARATLNGRVKGIAPGTNGVAANSRPAPRRGLLNRLKVISRSR